MRRFLFGLCLIFGSEIFADSLYVPFGHPGFLTSSFGESRGTRYHAGVDFSTEMQEGFPVTAPENGHVEKVALSPFGYGKVVYFRGESGNVWVFAHQSGFAGALDSAVSKEQARLQKNDVRLENPAIRAYQKGDTISFTGSSGIGNPHLHLELRPGSKIVNPCRNGTLCMDTLDPLILGAASFAGEKVRITGEEALSAGCVEIPEDLKKKEALRFAFKIADYSRTPLENPMSVRRVTLKSKGKILDEIIKDTLSFASMIEIREELLWAEEADTAGDWHYLPKPLTLHLGDTIVFETEDMVGRVSTRSLALSAKCDGEKPLFRGKNQRAELFSFLSRAWLGLDLCGDSLKTDFALYDHAKKLAGLCTEFSHEPKPLGEILAKFPHADRVVLTRNFAPENSKADTVLLHRISPNAKKDSWKISLGGFGILQEISKLEAVPWSRVLAVRKFESDSVFAFEFHPKGLHFLGSWSVEFLADSAPEPLYYLGETSRRWFLFSKQQAKKRSRKTAANELRDIGFIRDTTAPEIGEARLDSAYVSGKLSPVLRIPVIEKESGIPNGNAVRAFSDDAPFIYAEYDSEPQEIVLVYADLPKAGKAFSLSIQDEAGNSKTFHMTVPEITP